MGRAAMGTAAWLISSTMPEFTWILQTATCQSLLHSEDALPGDRWLPEILAGSWQHDSRCVLDWPQYAPVQGQLAGGERGQEGGPLTVPAVGIGSQAGHRDRLARWAELA